MKNGSTGFVASRLPEARHARGIKTKLALANLMGVNVSSVSRWEDGSSSPTTDALELLAAKLNVRMSYFLREQPAHGTRPFFARSLASARRYEIDRQRTRLRWAQEISFVLQHYLEFPEVDIPDVMKGESYKTLRNEDIERIAIDLRQHWKLGEGPITDVVSTLEEVGFVVCCDEAGSIALDGLCNWSDVDNRPYIILATDKMSFPRRQMDAAHEMAHAVLHRHVTIEDLQRDFHLIETQAFRLASAFLMPHTTFPLEVHETTLTGLSRLKERWRVSVKAMIKRLQDIDLIDTDSARQLYKQHSARGWTRKEPLNDIFSLDKPKLLSNAIIMIVEAGVRRKSDLLASEFVIPAKDVEDLTGLSEGWFSRGEAEIISFKPSANVSMKFEQSNEVIPFRRTT